MVEYHPESETFSLNPMEVRRAAFGFSGGEGLGTKTGAGFFRAYSDFQSGMVREGISNLQFADAHAAAIGMKLHMMATGENIEGVRDAILAWQRANVEPVLAIRGIKKTPYFSVAQEELSSSQTSIAELNVIFDRVREDY